MKDVLQAILFLIPFLAAWGVILGYGIRILLGFEAFCQYRWIAFQNALRLFGIGCLFFFLAVFLAAFYLWIFSPFLLFMGVIFMWIGGTELVRLPFRGLSRKLKSRSKLPDHDSVVEPEPGGDI